jgi:hypothetical protein
LAADDEPWLAAPRSSDAQSETTTHPSKEDTMPTDSKENTTPTDPRGLAEAYFDAWKNQDFDALRAVLADDVTFRGPLGEADNAEECIAGLKGMSKTVADIVVLTRLVEGPDVVTLFNMHTHNSQVCLTANWSHVNDGKIASIHAIFDPRHLL